MCRSGGATGSGLEVVGTGMERRRKEIGETVVDCEGIIGCRADLAGLERRSFLDRSTNKN